MNYLTKNEIAVHNFSSARRLAEELLENGYVVMISKEENLFIVNYVWSEQGANRNNVVFNSREAIEDIIFDREEEKND